MQYTLVISKFEDISNIQGEARIKHCINVYNTMDNMCEIRKHINL